MVLQLHHRLLPRLNMAAVAQRMVQPQREQAAAHVGGAVVEHRKQGGRFFAGKRLGDFKIAAGGRVHADVLAFAFEREAVEVLRQVVLGEADVVQQRARRADRFGVFVEIEAEAAQILAAEIIGKHLGGGVGGKLPMIQPRDIARLQRRCVFAVGQQNFRRLQTRQLVV